MDTFVEFPLAGLDMSSYLIRNLSSTRFSNANSCLYDLAAVIVHHGNGMGSGSFLRMFFFVYFKFFNQTTNDN